MADVPILFSGPMVRALLDGRKTRTRRMAWKPWSDDALDRSSQMGPDVVIDGRGGPTVWQRRYDCWQAGDRELWIWVREKHWCVEIEGGGIGVPWLVFDEEWTVGPPRLPEPKEDRPWLGPPYFDDENQEIRWGARPSIHMPRWASRLSLRVTDMRLERLQDISEEDVEAEGAVGIHCWDCSMGYDLNGSFHPDQKCQCGDTSVQETFGRLWVSIHGPGSWARNEDVIAMSFTVHQQNIDAIAAGAIEGER